MAVDQKRCNRCGVVKPVDDFYPRRNRRDGRGVDWKCKPCRAEYQREWYQANRHRVNQRRTAVLHGVTVEDLVALIEAQSEVCAICGAKTKLVVDHDHQCCPGKYSCGDCVRGLLCSNCNTGIGLLSEDPVLIRKALAYLEAGV